MTWVLAACQSLLSRDSREMESCDQRGGHIPTGPTGKRLALCPQDHLLRVTMGLDDPTQETPQGSECRLCVGSMEQGPGALNGEVKADDPAAPGSVGQRARELCFCQETAPSLSTPCCLQQHQDLHPYSEMSVLTRPHFLGSQVIRTVSPVRLDGELWVSDIHVDTLGLPAAV